MVRKKSGKRVLVGRGGRKNRNIETSPYISGKVLDKFVVFFVLGGYAPPPVIDRWALILI
jgi:hypothetical protein